MLWYCSTSLVCLSSATLPDHCVAVARAGDFGRLRPAVSLGEKPGGCLEREERRHLGVPIGCHAKMYFVSGCILSMPSLQHEVAEQKFTCSGCLVPPYMEIQCMQDRHIKP